MDDLHVRTEHAELTLREIAQAVPGTGEIMASVGRCYARCWRAAHGGNWDLAAYYLRRVRALQRGLAVIRPKYRIQLQDFDHEALEPLAGTIEARDLPAFDRAYEKGTSAANRYHVETGRSYLRWRRPEKDEIDVETGPLG